jgi:hypothetical protein
MLDYFSEVSEVCKVLIKLTRKDYVTDLTLHQDIITENAASAHEQFNAINFISDVNKQAIKKRWGEKIGIATANFIMVQIIIEGLKPEIKNEMVKNPGLPWLMLLVKQKNSKNTQNRRL